MAIEKRVEMSDGTPAVPVPVPVRPYPSAAVSLGLLALRVPVGLYFILAGVGKFRMEGGVAKFVELQAETAAKYMPAKFANMYLNALPYAEIVLGAMLVVGFLTRFVGLVMTLLLVSFTIAVGMKYPPLPFHPNLVYVGAALAILLCGPGRFSVDGMLFGPRRRVTITEQYTERLP